MAGFLQKLFSIGSEKSLKELDREADKVMALAPQFEAMDDTELMRSTQTFRDRLDRGETLDDLLSEAFAAVREASRRTTGLYHFKVQVMGGISLHRGNIVEMKTGEGKTLVSTLAGYLNALLGKGVHIITVNDYLAERDSEWMGRIYRYLGLNVGLIVHDKAFVNGVEVPSRRKAYMADITYGTNAEFGFDYLRDNMVPQSERRVQRGHYYAIVDEADSILIDEARTPLIISGMPRKESKAYEDFNRVVRNLRIDEDYELDEARHTIADTEEGRRKIEKRLEEIIKNVPDEKKNLYDLNDPAGANHLQQALKANYMYHRDQQYVVIKGQSGKKEVKIVDEFTGRIMGSRRYSEGLHEAIEAKENVAIKEESQTLATITLQNYFLMYEKLAGMTGTALTEDAEFREVYHAGVEAIPPNKAVIRQDHEDVVYRTIDLKFNAIAKEIKYRHEKGQPCLIGTVSVESSERLSDILRSWGISHNVLNAKEHQREAGIIAQAGRKGVVTIATNMAGRGTDIILGGNRDALVEERVAEKIAGLKDASTVLEEQLDTALREHIRSEAQKEINVEWEQEHKEVIDAGGLCVIGTERHESRRIDNQLRGRSGRQGDPGETIFYLSLEDDLMRKFAGKERLDKIATMLEKTGESGDRLPPSKMVSRAIADAQRRVEEVNFAMRKRVLDYDNVMNAQREKIYEERNRLLDGEDPTVRIDEIIHDVVAHKIVDFASGHEQAVGTGFVTVKMTEEELIKWVREISGDKHALDGIDLEGFTTEELTDHISSLIKSRYDNRIKTYRALSQIFVVEKLAKDCQLSGLRGTIADHIKSCAKSKVSYYLDGPSDCGSDARDATSAEILGCPGLVLWLKSFTGEEAEDLSDAETLDRTTLVDRVASHLNYFVEKRSDSELSLVVSRSLMMYIDSHWRDYLREMDYLKTGIGLRGYGQRDPLVEYRNEAYYAFEALVNAIYEDFLMRIMNLGAQKKPDTVASDDSDRDVKNVTMTGPSDPSGDTGTETSDTTNRTSIQRSSAQGQKHSNKAKPQTYRKDEDTDPYAHVGRNDLCPCGSGKKFKKCHGRNR